MKIQSLNRWIILRVRFADEALWVNYEDDAGSRSDSSSNFAVTFSTASLGHYLWPSNLPHYLIHSPADLLLLLTEAISSLPLERKGPHASEPVPLPIFIDRPPEMPDLPWATIIEQIIEQLPYTQINMARVQTVYLARKRWTERPAFRLPLRVLAVGTRCQDALHAIQSADWYIQDREVQMYGLQFETVEPNIVSRTLRAEVRDVVLVEDKGFKELLKSAARLANPATARPRLVIVLSESDREPYSEEPFILPGISLLWMNAIAGVSVADFIKQLFYGIIHNYPLHEALKAATRDANLPPVLDLLLFADPKSNYYLRLSDTLSQLHWETLTLDQTVARGKLDAFFERMGENATNELRSVIETALEERQPIKDAVRNARDMTISFEQETRSLVPLAHAQASLVVARVAEQKVRAILAPVLKSKAYVESVEKHQDRRVDVALEHLNPETMIYRPIEPNQKLSKGARYRLRVHIGRPSIDSLMVGEPPPLDPLLPEPEWDQGHTLEVVVFEKDFTLLSSPRVQLLHLPPLRGSQPVYFELLAPQRDIGELRIGIYHKNHLLQSFILEARIGEGEWVYDQERQVTVRLNFSRTARFTNLNELAPRVLSIGVNQNQNETTHAFMLKRNNEAMPFDLTEAIVSDQLKTFRKMLQEATADSSGNPRFPTFSKPGTVPSSDFEEVIRNLANFGREIYRGIFIRSTKKMQKELRDIAAKVDETIQIVRHDPNFAFPWPVLYDFPLPQKNAGAQQPRVCLGVADDVADASSAKDAMKLCSHGPKDKVYCIYGFWGLRHRVEQLVALGNSLEDAVNKVEPNPQSGIYLAVGENDEHTAKMTNQLRHRIGAAVVELAPGDDLLDVLWQAQKRPAILVTVGHLETADISGEPIGPRIILQPKKQWLQATSITDRQISDGDWEQPRTLVLLMACGAAATDVTTLNDLVTAFTSVGAAAIAGTECVVFSRLVVRFAEEVTIDLWNGLPLGESVKNFNRRLVKSGNPLAFVFSYLGDADLKIVPQEGG